MTDADISELYINDCNFEFVEKLHEHIDSRTQNSIEILRRVRSVLLINGLKFETFSFSQLEDILLTSEIDQNIITHIITGLSSYFDEFQPLDFTALENFEKRLVALDIHSKAKEAMVKE